MAFIIQHRFSKMSHNGKSVAVVSGLLATKREAKTTKTTNTKVQRITFNPELQQHNVVRGAFFKTNKNDKNHD